MSSAAATSFQADFIDAIRMVDFDDLTFNPAFGPSDRRTAQKSSLERKTPAARILKLHPEASERRLVSRLGIKAVLMLMP
jgi:hypothetical protein